MRYGRLDKLPVPLNKNYYLRYCPLCVKEDRLNYGESYYHVEHMFPYINVCPNHNCKLIDTKLRITSEYNKAFVPSEELIDKLEADIYDKTNINVIVSKYIYNLFKEPMKYDVEESVGKFLASKLKEKYLSIRCKRKNLDSLYDDFKEYYKELNGFNISKNRLSRIYSGTCKNTYYICLVALFEGISIKELMINRIDDIDEEVRYYYEKGYNYSKIAFKVGISKETARRIIIGRDYNCGWSRSIKGKSRCDWNELDNKYCSRFKKEFKGCKVITKKLVAESFGIKDKKLRKFPKLSNMILECKKSML